MQKKNSRRSILHTPKLQGCLNYLAFEETKQDWLILCKKELPKVYITHTKNTRMPQLLSLWKNKAKLVNIRILQQLIMNYSFGDFDFVDKEVKRTDISIIQ